MADFWFAVSIITAGCVGYGLRGWNGRPRGSGVDLSGSLRREAKRYE